MWPRPFDVAPRQSEPPFETGGALAGGASVRPGAAVPGDVIVRPLTDRAHCIYALSTVPGPDQLGFSTLVEASRTACDYARQGQVDVWADDGTGQVMRLARFRAGGTGASSSASSAC
jgi:hypothetical protein